ncbi:hypothetical protein TRICI_001750 [Trichomonascus ciferrii]|uniref:Peroxisome assembly protein 22 n=1 Tax=Trichomonascus ciferrii TaxID=44093 RepID=A0A642V8R7_9ASCO|nr:hypothetical protein TRICI_001750 [Trichomonascus ciferrii]
MSRRSSHSNRALMAPLAAVSLIAAAGYWAYSRYYAGGSQGSRVLASSKDKSTISLNTQTRISLLLTKFPNLVVIVAPDVTQAAELQLTAQIPGEVKYKVISCETDVGVIHVLKHLRSELVVLPTDRDIRKDIEKFVGEIKLLSEQLERANSELYDLFFKK